MGNTPRPSLHLPGKGTGKAGMLQGARDKLKPSEDLAHAGGSPFAVGERSEQHLTSTAGLEAAAGGEQNNLFPVL